MITFLRGTVRSKEDRSITLDVHDVGYRVAVTPSLWAGLALGATVELHTELIVREDAHELYGFTAPEELVFFRLLLQVTGVGPKSALAILSVATLRQVERAVREDDPSILTKVSGIGRKTAERIIIELREKVPVVGGSDEDPALRGQDDGAIEALRRFGYSPREARQALEHVPPSVTDPGERVRHALKQLGR